MRIQESIVQTHDLHSDGHTFWSRDNCTNHKSERVSEEVYT